MTSNIPMPLTPKELNYKRVESKKLYLWSPWSGGGPITGWGYKDMFNQAPWGLENSQHALSSAKLEKRTQLRLRRLLLWSPPVATGGKSGVVWVGRLWPRPSCKKVASAPKRIPSTDELRTHLSESSIAPDLLGAKEPLVSRPCGGKGPALRGANRHAKAPRSESWHRDSNGSRSDATNEWFRSGLTTNGTRSVNLPSRNGRIIQ